MSNQKIYKYFMYLAGVKVPLINCNISSNYASLAQLSITLSYSPYISHIFQFTKVQIYEQINDNGKLRLPTLEFDGVIIGITRTKNLLGQVSCLLTCTTDGVIWNRIRQYDSYLNELLDTDTRGKENVNSTVRADAHITNFYQEILRNNKFDIGCCIGSLLTSTYSCNKPSDKATGYHYFLNGKQFTKYPSNATSEDANIFTSPYYTKFLKTQNLQNRVYSIATSQIIKEFFNADQFINLLGNSASDLYGENTYWTIATKIMEYGFYNVYDIPNACFIPKTKKITSVSNIQNPVNIKIDQEVKSSSDNDDAYSNLSQYRNAISCIDNRGYDGIAEYVLKPISVLGIPFECNIIWPDQVLSDSIFYDMINAPTRTLLKKHYLPGQDQPSILTTNVYAGPSFNTSDGKFLSSYVPPNATYAAGEIRHENRLSPSETQYGVNYSYLELSYAFDSTLLNDADAQDSSRANKISNFLNYEFSQRFFGSRQYQVQVTPDVNIVNGLPIIILQNSGEHVIAFCTGVSKGWDISGEGHKWINIQVSYPRYYYENIGKLGNLVDPTSQDPNSLNELKLLVGSKSVIEPGDNTQDNLINKIESYYQEYLHDQSNGKENIKKKYARFTADNQNSIIPSYICDLDSYMQFMGQKTNFKTNLPDEYPNNLFESSVDENNLSNHYFKILEKDKPVAYGNGSSPLNIVSNRDIIKKHLEWIKTGQRI